MLHDIKADNTIFYEGKLYYIDFGLSLKFNETKSLILSDERRI